jgi:hypothetical protein
MTGQKKMGRPKAERPKNHDVKVRLDDVMYNSLQEHCTKHNLTVAEAIRTAIDLLIKK